MGERLDDYLVRPDQKIDLNDWDPDDAGDFHGKKAEGKARLADLRHRLDLLQRVLYAGQQHPILVILQGMDTSGKDGAIRHVFKGVNPQGVRVANFKVPTPEELDHDFLWRVHKQTPGKGEIAIFNRSHYEDVLVVRVHGLQPKEAWQAHYGQINDFERMLAQTGTVILKFFLHISKDEQKKRLEARRDEPDKRWKFNPGDLKERELWPEYMKAYQDVLNKTSTEDAPWVIVPANHKWYRDLVVAHYLVQRLEALDMRYPEPPPGIEQIEIV